MLIDLTLRWLHIFSAVLLAGGLLFMKLVLVPALTRFPDSTIQEMRESVRSHWARWVMITSTLLLVTGLVNAVRTIQANQLSGVYHGLVLVKLVGGMAIFWLAATLSGKSDTARRFRQRDSYWLGIASILILVVIGAAGYMRSVPRQPKSLPAPAVATKSEFDSPGSGIAGLR
jgi:putative copper export protein